MATAARSLTRLSVRGSTSAVSSFRSNAAARNTKQFSALSKTSHTSRTWQHSQKSRGYATAPSSSSGSSGKILLGLGIAALGGGGAYYYSQNGIPEFAKQGSATGTFAKGGTFTPKADDYQKVYDAIAKRLEEHDEYDDGSYGPVIVRLAWHCSGTYDAETKTGGSNGATMRFPPEGDHGANAGLKGARDFLAPVKAAYPWISYSDLWTLGGVCAIQEMQGPTIPWRPGREDAAEAMCTPDGRLPDGSKDQSHLRAIFGRMGFDDQEIVALSGAHALGRCHTDRSGFDGPWSFSPTVMTNDYFKLLLREKWNWKKWSGPKQYEDSKTKTLMMLPTDMALIKDSSLKKHVERYAKDNEVFFKEFRNVMVKLFELGVPFKSSGSDRLEFRTLGEAAPQKA